MTGSILRCWRAEPIGGLGSGRPQVASISGRTGDGINPRPEHASGMSNEIGEDNLNVEGVSLWFATASFAGQWRSWHSVGRGPSPPERSPRTPDPASPPRP